MSRQTYSVSPPSWQIYRWPLLINGISFLGLVSALIGNGWLDVLSWLCLGGSVVLMVCAYLGAVRTNKDRSKVGPALGKVAASHL